MDHNSRVFLTDVLIGLKFYTFSRSLLRTGFPKRMCVTIAVLIGECLGDQSILQLDKLGGTGEKMRMLKSQKINHRTSA